MTTTTTTTTPLPITFGVEIEALLIFTEPLLRHHLSTTTSQHYEIIKQIPDHARRALNQVTPSYQLKNPKYMGWALTTPAPYGNNDDEGDGYNERGYDKLFRDNFEEFGYRGYAGEILGLVQGLLLQGGGKGVRVHDHFAHCHDFSTWHLTHDTSLVGVGKEELERHLRESKRGILADGDGLEDVDSHPFELVSPVLEVGDESFGEIERFLGILVGTQDCEHTAIATELCGLHVHVGLPTPVSGEHGSGMVELPPTFGVETLQHLAYLLVMYERSIGMLFPSWRRVGSEASRVDIISNLEEFFEEEEDDYEEGDWDINDDDNDNLNDDTDNETKIPVDESEIDTLSARAPPAKECPTIPFAKVRAKIFARDMTVQKLALLMGGTSKQHIVNWTYLARTDGSARTLEFRQHEGTLDAEAVRRWMQFVVGLVRIAEQNGRVFGVGNAGDGIVYAGEGYRYREWSEELGVEDLMEMMGLEEEGRKYFRGRVEMFAG